MTALSVDADASGRPWAIQVRGAEKRYGAVVALSGVDLKVGRGQVLGLIGDNGAGKSTLTKIISGAVIPDSGDIFVDGEPVNFVDPRSAREMGIEMVYQDLALCDHLDVASNFFLGREPRGRLRLLRQGKMHRDARYELQQLGIRIQSTSVPIRSLSGGQRQAVAIGRAVSFAPKVLIMDEPTAALGVRESALVLDLIKRVRDQGVGVVLISHRLQDVLEVCDRVTVIYEGTNVVDLDVRSTSLEDLVQHIVGNRQRQSA